MAAPVIAADAWRKLRSLASEVVALSVPDQMIRIGEAFEDFTPTSDEDVCRLLAENATRLPATLDTSAWNGR